MFFFPHSSNNISLREESQFVFLSGTENAFWTEVWIMIRNRNYELFEILESALLPTSSNKGRTLLGVLAWSVRLYALLAKSLEWLTPLEMLLEKREMSILGSPVTLNLAQATLPLPMPCWCPGGSDNPSSFQVTVLALMLQTWVSENLQQCLISPLQIKSLSHTPKLASSY